MNACYFFNLIVCVIGRAVVNNKDRKAQCLRVFDNLRHRPRVIIDGDDKSKTIFIVFNTHINLWLVSFACNEAIRLVSLRASPAWAG
jgi:uncharacterized DUF497 family protein